MTELKTLAATIYRLLSERGIQREFYAQGGCDAALELWARLEARALLGMSPSMPHQTQLSDRIEAAALATGDEFAHRRVVCDAMSELNL